MYFHMKSYSVNQLPVYNATSSNLGEKKTHFPEARESNADKAFRQWLFPVLKSQLTLITWTQSFELMQCFPFVTTKYLIFLLEKPFIVHSGSTATFHLYILIKTTSVMLMGLKNWVSLSPPYPPTPSTTHRKETVEMRKDGGRVSREQRLASCY